MPRACGLNKLRAIGLIRLNQGIGLKLACWPGTVKWPRRDPIKANTVRVTRQCLECDVCDNTCLVNSHKLYKPISRKEGDDDLVEQMRKAAEEDELRLMAMETATAIHAEVFKCKSCEAEFLSAEACEQHRVRQHTAELAQERNKKLVPPKPVVAATRATVGNVNDIASSMDKSRGRSKQGNTGEHRHRSLSQAKKAAQFAIPIVPKRIPTRPTPVYAPPARPPITLPVHPTVATMPRSPGVSVCLAPKVVTSATTTSSSQGASSASVSTDAPCRLNWSKPQKISVEALVRAVGERPNASAYELAEAFKQRDGLDKNEQDIVRQRLTAIRVTNRAAADQLRRILQNGSSFAEIKAELEALITKYTAGPDPRVCE